MSIKQAIEALESCTPGDYSTGHVIHPSYDEDKVNAALAALRSMPAEPVGERDALIAKVGEEMTFEAWFKTMCPVDGINAKIAARAAAQAAQPEAVSIKVLEIALDRLQYISDFFCDEAGGDDWHLKGVAIDALEEIQRVRASAPTEPMSAPTAEPVAPTISISLLPCPFCGHEHPEFERMGNRRQSCIVICGWCGARHESSDEGHQNGASWNSRATPPSAATPEPSDAERLDAMQRHRIAVIPEYEGPWDAQVYGEDGEPSFIGSGDTPRQAIDAAIHATKGGKL